MPTEKTVLLYTYEELSDKAKEKAREWFSEGIGQIFSDYVDYDDFLSICERMGVTVAMNHRGKRPVPEIEWTGFWSQGDGASFKGSFSATDFKAAEDIRTYVPTDERLHAIYDGIAAIVADYGELTAAIVKPYGNRYSHECTMYLDEVQNGEDADGEPGEVPETVETALRDLMRGLAQWLYRYLETEYEYQTSAEQAEERILANEYTFLADGTRED